MQKQVDEEKQKLGEVLEVLDKKLKRAGNARTKKDVMDEKAQRESDFLANKRKLERTIPTREILELDYKEESEDEELPLYFQEPQQLIEAFVRRWKKS